jgi:hypothetical protein
MSSSRKCGILAVPVSSDGIDLVVANTTARHSAFCLFCLPIDSEDQGSKFLKNVDDHTTLQIYSTRAHFISSLFNCSLFVTSETHLSELNYTLMINALTAR